MTHRNFVPFWLSLALTFIATGVRAQSMPPQVPGDSVSYSTVTENWVLKVPPAVPLARYNHAMAYDSRRARTVLFGGTRGFELDWDTYELTGTNWAKRTPLHSPPGRYGHAMAYDSRLGETVLYGGCGGSGTWVWDGTDWTERHPVNDPGDRCIPMMAFDSRRGVTVLFGGLSSRQSNETWEWDGSDWSLKATMTNRPSSRYAGGMAFDEVRGVIVLHGGASSGYSSTNDTWEWNGLDWTLRSSVGPPSRVVPSFVYDNFRNRIVLFGGQLNEQILFGDTWEWDGSTGTWTQRTVSNPPTPRLTSMAFDRARGVAVMFGGSTFPRYFFKDTWEWNGAAGTWTNTIVPIAPPARTGPLAYDSRRSEVVLYGGGLDCACAIDETWVYTAAGVWIKRIPIGSPPPARSNHSLAYDSNRGFTTLFGGAKPYWVGGTRYYGDTWEWDGSTWIVRQPVNSPPGRFDHSLAFDAARGKTVLFGGRTDAQVPFGDTWLWDGVNWTPVSPIHSPPARWAGAMTFDSGRGVVVLFGGYSPTGGALADTWEWDGNDWKIGAIASAPGSKYHVGLAYDMIRGVTVLLGGAGSEDTWEWNGAEWTQKASTSSLSARLVGPAMVYDRARSAIVVFGGGNLTDDTWEYVSSAPADTSPPSITHTITAGTLGSNGWYISNVSVSWSVTDPESGIASSSGCGATTLTSDTSGTTVTCSATNGRGLTNTVSVTIKIDKTPPVVAAACPVAGPFLNNSGAQSVGPIAYDASVAGINSGLSMLTGLLDTSTIGTKNVTFKAIDNAGNTSTKSCSYNVIASATIQVVAALHTVGSGANPGTNKSPLALDLRVYDKVVVGPSDPKDFGTTWNSGTRITAPLALISGPSVVSIGGGAANQYNILVPANPNSITSGSYLVIGKATVDSQAVYVGRASDPLTANTVTQMFLQVMKNGNGKIMPATTTVVPGSMLLIVEPAYLEFTSNTELLPVVYESVDGIWGDTVQANPPEGFVSTPGALTVDVTTGQLKAVQFTVKDVGSAWTFTTITHRLKHKGQEKVITHNIGMVNKQKKK